MAGGENNGNGCFKVKAKWIVAMVVALAGACWFLVQANVSTLAAHEKRNVELSAQLVDTMKDAVKTQERTARVLERIDEHQRNYDYTTQAQHVRMQDTLDGISLRLGDKARR